ncbi:MAG: PAS domain-containing sensor histidine kinase [Polyangiaceae bacterium]|nr:PAS domain-containing sensor histidine kinase [Polyangiaceae bacterium]
MPSSPASPPPDAAIQPVPPPDPAALAEAVLAAVGAFVVVLDRHGRIVRFNDTCERATGWTEAELIGQRFMSVFVPPEQRPGVEAVFEALSAGAFPNRHENDWLRRDGSRITIAWSNTCTVAADGSVDLVIGTGTDVTPQRRAEAAFAAVVQHTPNVAVQVYERDGTIVLWNDASTRMFGWTAAETEGRSARETFLAARGFEDLLESIEAVEQTHAPVGPGVYPVQHREGGEVLAFSTVFGIPGAGDARRYVCMDVDVTATARIERALRVAAGAPPEGPFVALARELASLAGARWAVAASVSVDGSRAEVRALIDGGRPLEAREISLAGSACAEVLAAGACRLATGAALRFPDDPLLAPCGAESFSGVRLAGTGGQALGVLAVFHERPLRTAVETTTVMDLFATRLAAELERERADAATRALAEELERRVVERTAALAASRAELESFSYAVSHDLRAPLRAVTGFAQALAEDHGARLPPDGVELLGRIQAAGARMGRLIEDLLTLARLSRRELTLEDVDVSSLARELGAELAAAAPAREVQLEIEPGLRARADAGLLRVALMNLLSNAWKYTVDAPAPRVHLGSRERDGQRWLVVEDNGMGFDPRWAGQAFEPFQRLHASSVLEGSGIGLATVARVVRRHGGLVLAEGEVGRGARFSLYLP